MCSDLAAFRACFPCNSKNFQVSFSPFVFKITSFFLERMGIAFVPWRSMFSLTFFNLMGATASNVLEQIVPMLLVISSCSFVFMGTESNLDKSGSLFVNLSLVVGTIVIPGR